jgi:cytidylate kinase
MSADAGPLVVVLAGPHGAGKTTCARSLLAQTLNLMTFVNTGVLAQGLADFRLEGCAFEAGRIMLQPLHALADQRAAFTFKTTLAGRSYARFLRSLRQMRLCGTRSRKAKAMADLSEPSALERLKDRAAITAAIQRGVREALLTHARAGNPVVAWRDGQVVWASPEEVLATLQPPGASAAESG